jgi:deoxycytidylate deaminase
MTIEQIANSLKEILCSSERFISMDQYVGEFFLIAATLDKRNRIISIGENSLTKTHPLMYLYSNKVQLQHKIYLHAEVSALVKSYTKAQSILVIRVNREGNFAMACPCPICMMAIKEAGIKKVWYSSRDGDISMMVIKE